MVFSQRHSKNFHPQLVIGEPEPGDLLDEMELVSEMKLLGVVLSNDLSWESNTKYQVGRGWRKMWMVKRLAELGVSVPTLVKIYCQHVRSTLF